VGTVVGVAGALVCIDGHEDMLDEPLDPDSIEIGSFRGLIPFDRWSGISCSTGICTDINKPLQFGLPESYQVHPPTGGASVIPSTSLCTSSNIGSLYSNTNGGATTTLYVCTAAGTWTAK
jgi:hypothetical protein